MRIHSLVKVLVIASLFFLVHTPLVATIVQQLNLAEMTQRASRIYLGTVLSTTEGTVEVGGGQLPVVTYRISVEEDLLGVTPETGDERIAEIRMLGKSKPVQVGNIRSVAALPDLPVLAVGQTYLIFTTQPSAIGLSTTVGLGQGCFKVYGRGEDKLAVNEVNNSGLFRGMDPAGPAGNSSPRESRRPTIGMVQCDTTP
jgi:hypothetical protein